MTRLAVVGHVEWVTFLAVDQLPQAGQITPARRIRENAGGGAVVAAAIMVDLCGEVDFFSVVGDDEHGDRAITELQDRGITVHAARRPQATREVITFIDARGERSITTIGERLQPQIDDPLPWETLAGCDGVYFTAGGRDVLHASRRAERLVVTPRICERLKVVDVPLDAVVFSADDRVERAWAQSLQDASALQVMTEGERGGSWSGVSSGRWQPAPVPGPIIDSYGAGDSFAGGLTFGLGSGLAIADAAEIAAQCGAGALTHPGGP